jgi:hypothetical protein
VGGGFFFRVSFCHLFVGIIVLFVGERGGGFFLFLRGFLIFFVFFFWEGEIILMGTY